MNVGDRVKLKTFNGIRNATEESIDEQENFWKLIDETGVVVQDPEEETIYASFSKQKRVLVQFDCGMKNFNLICHNNVENSLWILETDLEIINKPFQGTEKL